MTRIFTKVFYFPFRESLNASKNVKIQKSVTAIGNPCLDFCPYWRRCSFRLYANSGSRANEHILSDYLKPDMSTIWNCYVNKGLAFTMEERQLFGIIGLLPAIERTYDEQIFTVKMNFDYYHKPLNKYEYLLALRNRNERLFFRFVQEYIEDCMPIIYTPTVGQACLRFGMIYHNPYGIYVSKYDRNHVKEVLSNWRIRNVDAVCVTDGERILGLGDLGASGMAIPIGKLQLYTALAGIHPHGLLPVVLDVGTNNEDLLKDPFYIGLREKRITGPEYDDLMEEFIESVLELYGTNCLVHFEDFSSPNAFRLLEKYQHKICCFNDDIQGTSATVLAGILGAKKVTGKSLMDNVYCFVGTGSAAMGIARLLYKQMLEDGNEKEEALSRIHLIDVKGLITTDREDLVPVVQPFAKELPAVKSLEDAIKLIEPNVLIGASGSSKIFNETVLRTMAELHERPVVMALSNPTSKSECSADEAFRYTDGRVVFSSGSPYPPVIWEGETYYTGQANNSLVFPGIALGAIASEAHLLPDEIYLIAAHTLANFSNKAQYRKGSLYPRLSAANDLALEIAINICKYIFGNGLSGVYPVPKDICAFIKSKLFSHEYSTTIHSTWPYPRGVHVPVPKLMPQE